MTPSFLGRGITRPFRRDQKNDFASASGADLVYACGEQVLGTRATSPLGSGELPWRPEFGSKLHLIRHRNINPTTKELARAWASEALQRWEPRLRVQDISFEALPSKPTALVLVVHVIPITQNVQGNQVQASKLRVRLT